MHCELHYFLLFLTATDISFNIKSSQEISKYQTKLKFHSLEMQSYVSACLLLYPPQFNPLPIYVKNFDIKISEIMHF